MYFHKETRKKIHKRPTKSVICKELIGDLCPGEELGEGRNEVERRLFYFNQVHDLPAKRIERENPLLPVDWSPWPSPGLPRQPSSGTLSFYRRSLISEGTGPAWLRYAPPHFWSPHFLFLENLLPVSAWLTWHPLIRQGLADKATPTSRTFSECTRFTRWEFHLRFSGISLRAGAGSQVRGRNLCTGYFFRPPIPTPSAPLCTHRASLCRHGRMTRITPPWSRVPVDPWPQADNQMPTPLLAPGIYSSNSCDPAAGVVQCHVQNPALRNCSSMN